MHELLTYIEGVCVGERFNPLQVLHALLMTRHSITDVLDQGKEFTAKDTHTNIYAV
jgi:hypothetical protein